MALNCFPDEVVDQIAAKLPHPAAEDRVASLSNLLRHWAVNHTLHAEIGESRLEPKETRKRLLALRRAMKHASFRFRAISDEGVMMLSRELEGPLPVTEAYGLLRNFVALAACVVAASTRAVSRKPKPGPRDKDALALSICSLAEIYTYMTGLEPTRTADPIGQKGTGPFVAFAHACLKAYDPKMRGPFDWPIRRAFELRARGEDRQSYERTQPGPERLDAAA